MLWLVICSWQCRMYECNPQGHFRFEGPAFPTVQELILHQYQSSLPVTGRSGAVLRKPILRERWELNNDDVVLLDKIGRVRNFILYSSFLYTQYFSWFLEIVYMWVLNFPDQIEKALVTNSHFCNSLHNKDCWTYCVDLGKLWRCIQSTSQDKQEGSCCENMSHDSTRWTQEEVSARGADTKAIWPPKHSKTYWYLCPETAHHDSNGAGARFVVLKWWLVLCSLR